MMNGEEHNVAPTVRLVLAPQNVQLTENRIEAHIRRRACAPAVGGQTRPPRLFVIPRNLTLGLGRVSARFFDLFVHRPTLGDGARQTTGTETEFLLDVFALRRISPV